MALARLGLVVHPDRPLENALRAIADWAAQRGADVVQVRVDGQTREVAPAGAAGDCDVVLALGGDGTTLAALHAAAPADRPVLGVACGSLGALTATSAGEVAGALDRLERGDWHARRLPAIAAVADDDGRMVPALNDLVVVRRGASQVAIELHVGDELYARFAGDGVVIATPLGSSAYTLGAGGPLLAPGAQGIVVTALAAHGGRVPPIVVDAATRLRIAVTSVHGGARLEVDGQVVDAAPATLTIAWRPDHATLVAFAGGEGVLTGLRRRRIVIDSPRLLARDERAAAPLSESSAPTARSPARRSPS
jgi:NAD+ kinase